MTDKRHDDTVREAVTRIKALASLRIPQYDLPADSFLADCARDILSMAMTEARARELIERSDYHRRDRETTWTLDGYFTADELEAFAWWLRNKPGEEP